MNDESNSNQPLAYGKMIRLLITYLHLMTMVNVMLLTFQTHTFRGSMFTLTHVEKEQNNSHHCEYSC